MGLAPVLSSESDENHPAIPHLGLYHARLFGDPFFTNQPSALKNIFIRITHDGLVLVIVSSRLNLKRRAGPKQYQTLFRHSISQGIVVGKMSFEGRAGTEKILPGENILDDILNL